MINSNIAVGQDSSGRLHLLYLGEDVSKAVAIAREAGMETEVYRKPVHFKRFPAPVAIPLTEGVIAEVEAEQEQPEVPVFESPKTPTKKKR
jgi:hypothetical protein